MKLKRAPFAFLLMLAVTAAACGGDDPTGIPKNNQNQGHVFTFRAPAGQTVSSVSVAGSFNEWKTTALPMTKQADGTWKATLKLDPGTYQYKFVINGDVWVQNMCNDPTWGDPAKGGKVDPNVVRCEDDGFGGQNAVLTIQ